MRLRRKTKYSLSIEGLPAGGRRKAAFGRLRGSLQPNKRWVDACFGDFNRVAGVAQETSTKARIMSTSIDKHQLHGLQPVLQVENVLEAVNWYHDKLGFDIDFIHGDPPVHARVRNGNVYIRFIPFGLAILRADRGYDWIHVGEDLDGLFEAYRRAGVTIVAEPTDQPWGLRDFRIRDPDGHVHCFAAEIP